MSIPKDLLAKFDAGSVEALMRWKGSTTSFPLVYTVVSGPKHTTSSGQTIDLPSKNEFCLLLSQPVNGILVSDFGRPKAVLTMKANAELVKVVDETNRRYDWSMEIWVLDGDPTRLCEAELERRSGSE